jgi:iron complex transport system substrate-binding protein
MTDFHRHLTAVLTRGVFCLWAATLPAGCGPPPEPVPVPEKIERIVSMAPSLTECLYAVGAGGRMVGATAYCNYPEEACALPRIGGYTDANYEKIYVLRPDLVVLLDEHYMAADRLDALGIPHVLLDTSTIPDIFNTLDTLGRLLDTEETATQVVADLRRRIRSIQEKTATAPRRRNVLVSIGRNMGSGELTDVYVAGRKTLYNEMLETIGAHNVYEGNLEYARISHEAIMQLAPDAIIDLIPDLESSSSMSVEDVRKEWNILEGVPAVENGQVYVFGNDYVCVPGPRFIRVLEDMARAVYPERFDGGSDDPASSFPTQSTEPRK